MAATEGRRRANGQPIGRPPGALPLSLRCHGCYVSIDDRRELQREGVALVVLDVETGENVTPVLLA
jgi:hypothetical protein